MPLALQSRQKREVKGDMEAKEVEAGVAEEGREKESTTLFNCISWNHLHWFC